MICVIRVSPAERAGGAKLGSKVADGLPCLLHLFSPGIGISSKRLSLAETRERSLHFTMDKEGSFVEFCMAWGPKYATDKKT